MLQENSIKQHNHDPQSKHQLTDNDHHEEAIVPLTTGQGYFTHGLDFHRIPKCENADMSQPLTVSLAQTHGDDISSLQPLIGQPRQARYPSSSSKVVRSQQADTHFLQAGGPRGSISHQSTNVDTPRWT